jgi:hypothetical protein
MPQYLQSCGAMMRKRKINKDLAGLDGFKLMGKSIQSQHAKLTTALDPFSRRFVRPSNRDGFNIVNIPAQKNSFCF